VEIKMRFGSLIGELHRRSVWQVLGSYAVVAWIVLQLAETLEGLIGLPLWFGRSIVVVVLLGFPILLVTTLTQGGWKRGGLSESSFRDVFEGGDESLSTWESLERNPLKRALRHVFTWRNAIAGGGIAAIFLIVGTAGYSGLRSAGIGPLGSLLAKGVFESNESLILSEFDDRTSDGTLGETVTALFRIDLSQSTSVHLLDRSELSQGLVRMERDPTGPVTAEVAMELAQREGVKAVVAGEVLPLGTGAVVSARLVAAGSSEILVALRETARTIDAVPEAVDRLSAQMRERIGESLRSIQGDPPLEEVTTASIEALRKYVQAEWAMDMGDVATAEALVKEAIALDSTFSMAHRKLGVILSNESRNGEEAREAFTRAYEGRERLTDRERLLAEAAYHTYVSEDLDAAIQAYEGVLAIHPTDGIAGNNLAVLYGERDEPEKAAALHVRAIEGGHAPAVSYTNAVATLFDMGLADSASAILGRFIEEHPNHPQVTQYATAMASARFDYETAERLARGFLDLRGEDPRWRMWAEAELASYAMLKGRLEEGAAGILRSYDLQEEVGTRFIDQPRSVFEATGMATLRLHFLQDAEGAARILEQALDDPEVKAVDPESRAHLAFAELFAQAGFPDRGRELMEAYLAEVSEETRAEEGRLSNQRAAEAAVALAEGDAQEAIRLYRESRSLAPKCDFCGMPGLGEAYEAAAQPDSAVSVYEEYLEATVLFRSQTDNVNLHRVLLGLARSYEALGDTRAAAEHYRRVLDLWSGADAALSPRVQEIRGKLMSLGEEGSS
jgi:tetratricopeptide (TPR) repeat protein/uncharacterized membrane protein YhdT